MSQIMRRISSDLKTSAKALSVATGAVVALGSVALGAPAESCCSRPALRVPLMCWRRHYGGAAVAVAGTTLMPPASVCSLLV